MEINKYHILQIKMIKLKKQYVMILLFSFSKGKNCYNKKRYANGSVF